MRTLVVTAVTAERDAAVSRLGQATNLPDLPHDAVAAGEVIAVAGGVGPVAAAVATTRMLSALDRADYPVELVISAGIGGGFAGVASIGDVVVSRRVAFADLGAATDEGFLDLSGLGLAGGAPLASPGAARVAAALTAAGLRPITGTILTLATMTGTDTRAAALAKLHPDGVAEAMEGYGVAWAASEHGLPWVEVRAVSNLIGRRDRSSWDIPAAFTALGAAIAAVGIAESRFADHAAEAEPAAESAQRRAEGRR